MLRMGLLVECFSDNPCRISYSLSRANPNKCNFIPLIFQSYKCKDLCLSFFHKIFYLITRKKLLLKFSGENLFFNKVFFLPQLLE